jgi:hypothetical protein
VLHSICKNARYKIAKNHLFATYKQYSAFKWRNIGIICIIWFILSAPSSESLPRRVYFGGRLMRKVIEGSIGLI